MWFKGSRPRWGFPEDGQDAHINVVGPITLDEAGSYRITVLVAPVLASLLGS